MNVIDLVRYNHAVRSLYFDAMAKLPWKEVIKPRGISFDSMRNVLLHLTIVEDRWINYTIQGRFSEWVDPNFEDYKDIDALRLFIERVRKNTEDYLKKLSPEELKRRIANPWSKKPNARIDVETALTHMVIEDLIHYGELSAVLWQMDLEAPYIGFWRYKLEPSIDKSAH